MEKIKCLLRQPDPLKGTVEIKHLKIKHHFDLGMMPMKSALTRFYIIL